MRRRFNQYIAPMAAVLLAPIPLSGDTIQPDTCLSPRTVSERYYGDKTPGITEDQTTWRLGFLAVTNNIPADVTGLVYGFRNPDNATAPWHDSAPIPPEYAREVVFKLGPGDVQVSAAYAAPAGSPQCNEAPGAMFQPPELLSQIPRDAGAPDWS